MFPTPDLSDPFVFSQGFFFLGVILSSGGRGVSQMPEEDLIELKFRLYDGTDIGPFHYPPTSTVSSLKDRILADWPKDGGVASAFSGCFDYGILGSGAGKSIGFTISDKKIAPKSANDIKLINAGKILENSKTVGQCRAPFGELPKSVITMHVVVQPSLAKSKTEKKVDEIPRKHTCSCTIM